MSNPYIFISHSSQDNHAVAEIVDDLQAQGIHVWVDFDRLESGTQWLNTIQDAIDDCAGFLVILSKVSRPGGLGHARVFVRHAITQTTLYQLD